MEEVAFKGFGDLLSYGPLGIAVVGLVWDRIRMQKKMDDKDEAHKIEIAAERGLNAQLHTDRLNDQKVLIPLSNSLVTAVEMIRQQDRK